MTKLAVSTPDGNFEAYVAMPAKLPAPVVVVIQEIFGVNAVMRGIADDYAKQGYIAVCPDLFWRIEPGIDITDQTEEEWKQAFGYYQAFDVDKGVEDIAATMKAARGIEGANGKVGVVGFCLGGLLTFLSATRTDGDAFAAYYGGGMNNYMNEADNIKKPLIVHLAGNDEYIPAEAQDAIKEALGDHPLTELHIYPGRDHAFARKGGAHYDEADANTANARTAEFFEANLV
ncbi:dienelactone hydrolase family protein [Thalassospira povalilytica]|uniref:dienelactone hydrolase family protein n=1 Tax=Thalassospira povalilytica TaxID=732237 RepID=UPI001D193B2E|nr:dienelactone hydrolase family protein [Thalassospira povalilytica]MCC4241116.1 dienelactone hydrolase family protein [Thalassospira povalilytica]